MRERISRVVKIYDEPVNSATPDKDIVIVLMNRGKGTGASLGD
jgi:hypothetical protein